MKGDFTRFTFDRKKHYSGIRMQQGRVQLDADWNELGDLQDYRMRTESADFIGPSGAPKLAAGFALRPTPDGRNLTLSPGRMYVDGILCESEEEVALTAQRDLPGFTLPQGDGLYLAYLEVWQRHVTALEDPSLREVGLGGPDTATRVKTVWQVKLLRVGDAGMPAGAATDFPGWTAEIAPSTGKLRASVQPGMAAQLRNCLYRVEVHRVDAATGKIGIKWSRDNGSVAGRWLEQSGAALIVENLGGTRAFEVGDWIELVDDACELWSRPGTLVRVIGVVENRLTIDPATATGPAELAGFPLSPKIRRWDSPGEIAVDPGAMAGIALEDGVEVQIHPGTFRPGDYWLIPARGAAGGIEWPRDGGGEPEAVPPQGIGRYYSRLALADLKAGAFKLREDCRFVFSSLTDLKELMVLQAAINAPDGAIYVDAAGKVGVGTLNPTTTLEINGSLRLQAGGAVSEISSDESLSGDSNESLPTERAVKEYVDNLLVGSLAAFAMAEPPSGWLKCDGQAIRRDQFGRLFQKIGTTYGTGDGETTFNVPDLRERSTCGWNDSQRAVGHFREDTLQYHQHSWGDSGGTGAAGGHEHWTGIFESSWVGDHSHRFGAGGWTEYPGYQQYPPAWASKKRGDVAVLYCIKY